MKRLRFPAARCAFAAFAKVAAVHGPPPSSRESSLAASARMPPTIAIVREATVGRALRVEGGVLLRPLREAALLHRRVQRLEGRAGVVDDLAGGGGLAIFQRVPATELHPVDAEPPGDHVHVPFYRERGLRHA